MWQLSDHFDLRPYESDVGEFNDHFHVRLLRDCSDTISGTLVSFAELRRRARGLLDMVSYITHINLGPYLLDSKLSFTEPTTYSIY